MQGAKLYEAHLNSGNLERSIKFYEKIGFKLAHTIGDRKAAFFFLGENKENMLGIWETKNTPIRKIHIAFSVSAERLREVIPFLTEKGILVRESFGLSPEEPIVHTWMPAASVYFYDPDGHSLEYIAVLEGKAKPYLNPMHLSKWEKIS
ncbi:MULTISPECIES: VOC family protein [unclassified Cytobacillus]|uniref:VOC family protein n=1 Tax=unclassified Cytobacillus TaxID=2675268 RepID=UPI0013594D2D|nr:VOC family protein [Cytobacillus sp. AMY 15.2]KAF0817052.1 Glyoxalase family protein [Bacillus sp. ZZV12-4809]MCM3090058.1 VOC family protein [Cytobacillus sp. AMY 15.2]